jgi:hypothetical protein
MCPNLIVFLAALKNGPIPAEAVPMNTRVITVLRLQIGLTLPGCRLFRRFFFIVTALTVNACGKTAAPRILEMPVGSRGVLLPKSSHASAPGMQNSTLNFLRILDTNTRVNANTDGDRYSSPKPLQDIVEVAAILGTSGGPASRNIFVIKMTDIRVSNETSRCTKQLQGFSEIQAQYPGLIPICEESFARLINAAPEISAKKADGSERLFTGWDILRLESSGVEVIIHTLKW